MEGMYPGKDKCAKLREIRKMIAEVNDIDFQPAECHHTGPCFGTCPLCDAEIKYLDGELQKKRARGETVFLTGLAAEEIRKSGCDTEPEVNEDGEMVDGGMDDYEDNELYYEDGKKEKEVDDVDGEEIMGEVRPPEIWDDWGDMF